MKRNYKKKSLPTAHPIHKLWYRYTTGCNNKGSYYWNSLGGKGLSICKEWLDFETFKKWAFEQGWEDGKSFHIQPGTKIIGPDTVKLYPIVKGARAKRKSTQAKSSYSSELMAALNDDKKVVVPKKDKTVVPNDLQGAIEFIMAKDYRETPYDAIRSSVLREANRLGYGQM